jgi:cobalt-zinc-cadmium efflux system membrane fusion protein
MNRHFAFFTLFGILCLPAVAEQKPAPRNSNMVILDEVGVRNLRVELVEAQEIDFGESVFALGRIEVLPGNKAVVSSRIPGRATEVKARPFTLCEKGDELVKVESRQAGDPPPTVSLVAPISGLIAKVDVSPGQPVNPDANLIEIYDLEEVEAVAQIPDYFAAKIKPELEVTIQVEGFEQPFEAKIEHLGAEADTATGTLEAACHLSNADLRLRPGMRAQFNVRIGSRPGVMAIPRTAVQGDAGQRFVYVADYELKNAFIKTPVVVGEQNSTMAEIISGLLPGDQVVNRGAYALSFAGKGSVSLKEALDAAHGHPHAEDGRDLTPEEQANASGGGSSGGKGNGFTSTATFFAITSVLLLVLLALSVIFGRRSNPA